MLNIERCESGVCFGPFRDSYVYVALAFTENGGGGWNYDFIGQDGVRRLDGLISSMGSRFSTEDLVKLQKERGILAANQ